MTSDRDKKVARTGSSAKEARSRKGDDQSQGATNMNPLSVAEAADRGAGLPPKLQAHLGRQLRAMFDEVAQEPIPDRLLQLLKQLDRGEPQE